MENIEKEEIEKNKIMIYFPEKEGKGRYTKKEKIIYDMNKRKLVEILIALDKDLDYKLSARGWCYITENLGIINKGQFNKIEGIINECRDDGLLPIDFTARDDARDFEGIEPFIIRTKTPEKFLIDKLKELKQIHTWKNDIAFWEDQPYYLMMVVEKIDLKTMFSPICQHFHIPIANAKGWSSKNMRYFITKKFKLAEQLNKIPVLLYYGDFDPYGVVKIAKNFRKHINEIEKSSGLFLKNMEFKRVGLTHKFIQENSLPWIDNLLSGSGKFPNYNDSDIQQWIKQYGEKKVEANAIVLHRDEAIYDLYQTILQYLNKDCVKIYQTKLAQEQKKIKAICNIKEIAFYDYIDALIQLLKESSFQFTINENNEKNSNQDSN